MREFNQKQCCYCGQLFTPVSGKQKYCKRPHYMTCPVCGKDYLVTYNDKLSKPPVACSYECRRKRAAVTSKEKYGTEFAWATPEARARASKTMQDKYGVAWAMQSDDIREKGRLTMLDKYGVENIQQRSDYTDKAHKTRNAKWNELVHELLPVKVVEKDPLPKFNLNDEEMDVYLLTEKASTEFLSHYGFRLVHSFRKIHLSVGLVNDGILYQVIRFERIPNTGKIFLSDFGIRDGYFNPNYYTKLMKFATVTRGIDDFEMEIPRGIVYDKLIESLSVEEVEKGDYEVYWKIDDKLEKLTNRCSIEEMLKKYDYVTTDYLDKYRYVNSRNGSEIDEILEFMFDNDSVDECS